MKRFPLTRLQFANFIARNAPQRFKRSSVRLCPLAQALREISPQRKFEIEPGVKASAVVEVGSTRYTINGMTDYLPKWASEFVEAYDAGSSLRKAAKLAGVLK